MGMTYEEAYRQCETKEDIIQMAKNDAFVALFLNSDRIEYIKKAANKVIAESEPQESEVEDGNNNRPYEPYM